MKRIAPYAFVAALALVAALGYAAAPKEISVATLPWLSDAMKAPCGKTTLEYNLAAGKLDPEPFQLDVFFDAIRFVGTPVGKGLVVRCDVRPRPGITFEPKNKGYSIWAGHGLEYIGEMARRRFCPNDKTAFINDKNLYILMYFNGRLVGVRTAEYVKVLSPPVNEDDAVRELLTH